MIFQLAKGVQTRLIQPAFGSRHKVLQLFSVKYLHEKSWKFYKIVRSASLVGRAIVPLNMCLWYASIIRINYLAVKDLKMLYLTI